VRLEFQHVFPGKRVGCRKVQRQAVVYGLAGCVRKRQVCCMAGLQRLAQPGLCQGSEVVPTDTQDPHRAAPGGAGNGNDGVGVGGRHRFS